MITFRIVSFAAKSHHFIQPILRNSGSRLLLVKGCRAAFNMCSYMPQYAVVACDSSALKSTTEYDSVVLVTDQVGHIPASLADLKTFLEAQKLIDAKLECEDASLISAPGIPGNRLIFSCTGSLNKDTDDVRKYQDAAVKGIKRSLKAGSKMPLLICIPDPKATFKWARLVTLLGALHALYVPLEIREAIPDRNPKAKKLGLWVESNPEKAKHCINMALALEAGRVVARDIGGSDPERMAAPRVAEYVQQIFKDSKSVKVEVLDDQELIKKEYPLIAAVNRAAMPVERHHCRVINLTYKGAGPITKTLCFVGKGVTYDTGGADIKAGGVMAGMHRDKCGAAAVAGFFKTLELMQPKGLKVLGAMGMVRNSVGSESYVSDEIITSRAGIRVRIGNTDAEGRMAMGDLLCHMREKALNEVDPHLFTIATLTGHAVIAVGESYSIVLDNGPAREKSEAGTLQQAGHDIGDPFEISTLRREDYAFNVGKSEYEDILQSNSAPSSRTPRGHQFPAAFLAVVSGLDKHGLDSDTKIKYSHIDIAGSSGPYPGIPTGAPVLALAAKYLFTCGGVEKK